MEDQLQSQQPFPHPHQLQNNIMRHKKVTKRTVEPDKLYNNTLVAKLINSVMRDGKKSVAEKVVYGAFEIIKQKKEDPLVILEKTVTNVSPKQEVKARRVGGASYQIPTEVRGERKMSLTIRWVIQAARARSSKDYHTFAQKLAGELLDASQNQGAAVKKKETMQRMADANRAFSHFRW